MATKKVQFFYYNLVDQDPTVITSGDENAQFPLSNLKDERSTKVYRSNSASDAVVFDFVTIEPVDSILVRGHLFDGIGFLGNLTIEANPTNDWTSPAFSTTLTPNPEYNMGYLSLPSTESYRFWRVSGSGAGYFELADIFIGKSYESERNISLNFDFDENDMSTYRRNRYRQRFTDELPDQKIFNGRINLIKKENTPNFRKFINYVGEKKSFWMIPDESECVMEDFEILTAKYKFQRKPRLKHVIRGIYNTSFTAEEAF